MIRAVLDTNVIVSALFWAGLPEKVFAAARSEQFTALITEVLIVELETVLSRDKFSEKLTQRQVTVGDIIEQYRAAAELVEPANIASGVVRDPKDREVLACAV